MELEVGSESAEPSALETLHAQRLELATWASRLERRATSPWSAAWDRLVQVRRLVAKLDNRIRIADKLGT